MISTSHIAVSFDIFSNRNQLCCHFCFDNTSFLYISFIPKQLWKFSKNSQFFNLSKSLWRIEYEFTLPFAEVHLIPCQTSMMELFGKSLILFFLMWLTDEVSFFFNVAYRRKVYVELIFNYFVILSSQNPLWLQRFRKNNTKLKCQAFKLVTAGANWISRRAFS